MEVGVSGADWCGLQTARMIHSFSSTTLLRFLLRQFNPNLASFYRSGADATVDLKFGRKFRLTVEVVFWVGRRGNRCLGPACRWAGLLRSIGKNGQSQNRLGVCGGGENQINPTPFWGAISLISSGSATQRFNISRDELGFPTASRRRRLSCANKLAV